ncbi:MAG: DUF5671 domain-containing protein [Candidatus Paceibacterota bacterium]|jgi:hypothetical protein
MPPNNLPTNTTSMDTVSPKMTPKDFFLHLGATIALYASAIALLNLLFSVINYFLPDRLAGYFYGNSIVWPVSMLIVLVPILYILEWLTNRDISITPEKREIWIRRWRIYLTLFSAGVAIIVDLIALINTYLNGEITSRFVYKILAVLIVSIIIFAYYLFERSIETRRSLRKILAGIGIIIVIAGIIGGFVAVGSPSKQRNLRFDNQRVNDLTNIQWQIINYWQNKSKLPNVLDDTNDPISGWLIPQDPKDDTDYVYNKKGDTTFELCAIFALPSEDMKNRGPTSVYVNAPDLKYNNDSWNHRSGNTCFDRMIDPEIYSKNELLRQVPVKQIIIQQ